MKKLFTLINLSLIASMSYAQITITSTDMPIPNATFHLDNFSANAPNVPTLGTNQLWDYSSYFGNTPNTNIYQIETNAFFTAAGIDVKSDGFKNFNANLGYNLTSEFDFNNNGVSESGISIPAQAYELSALTGSNLDSLVIPSQQYLVGSPKMVIKFPMTANTSWQSTSSHTTDFTLTVSAYLLNHTPAQHKYTVVRTDSIAGWGKLRVYTPTGASAPVDVLMDKIAQYAVDSFYLAGSPAPATLLTAFGVSQGQKTNVQYAYNFYRKGTFQYLMRLNCGNDQTYSNVAGAWAHTDNIAPSSSNDLKDVSYSTLIFPNPSNGEEINILLDGKAVKEAQFILTDLTGKLITQGKVKMENKSMMNIKFNQQITKGQYQLIVLDEQNVKIVSEKLLIN